MNNTKALILKKISGIVFLAFGIYFLSSVLEVFAIFMSNGVDGYVFFEMIYAGLTTSVIPLVLALGSFGLWQLLVRLHNKKFATEGVGQGAQYIFKKNLTSVFYILLVFCVLLGITFLFFEGFFFAFVLGWVFILPLALIGEDMPILFFDILYYPGVVSFFLFISWLIVIAFRSFANKTPKI